MVEAARRMKAACTATPGRVVHSSMCTSSGTNPARTMSRLCGRGTRRPQHAFDKQVCLLHEEAVSSSLQSSLVSTN